MLSLGGSRCLRRGPAWAASGTAAAEMSVKAAAPSRAGDGPEPGDARADNRAPEWSAGGRGWKEGAGAGVRTPPARPCGARGGCASRQIPRRSAFCCRPSPWPVRFGSAQFSPLARPPSHPPARAARSAIWAAPPPPPALYISSCQHRRRLLAGATEPRLLKAPDGAAGGRERALAGVASWGLLSPDSGPLP